MIKFIIIANYFFFIYLIIYATFITLSAFYATTKLFRKERLERLNNKLRHKSYYPMSIVVPAFNEELTIIDTINNLSKLRYETFEIVVVDDGSTDNTKKKIIETFRLKKYRKAINMQINCEEIKEYYSGKIGKVRLIMISKVNGKYKADASNAGINVCNYQYIVNMDADELLQIDALEQIGKILLEDEKIIALGGNIRISNNTLFKGNIPYETKFSKNFLSNSQEIEYSRAFNGARIFFNKMNANLIVSGGFGIFKKEALINVGGYDKKSMGEDMELTVKMHKYYTDNKIPYTIKHVTKSICWTQVPESIKDFKKQRQRWHCGLMQTLYKYKEMLFNPKYGTVGMIALPYSLIYEFLSPALILLGLIVISLSGILGILNIKSFLILMLIYVLFGLTLSIMTYMNRVYLSHDKFYKLDLIKAIFYALFDLLFIRTYLFIINFIAYFKLNTAKKGWTSPARVANRII